MSLQNLSIDFMTTQIKILRQLVKKFQ